MKYYVYSKYIKTSKTDFVREFDTQEDAIRHIAKCYRIDTKLGQCGEYYYYINMR